jgi:tetratricopeptide (TPR) repeat protein
MAATSEIEKLERRYAENPDGRYFAPLADAYRKTGELAHAIELVRAGLAKHPDYLSAHIVLGRCLLDKKDDAAAGQAFRDVLGLDPENIIALKSLAEIAERQEDPAQAQEWLRRLLKVDPMNAEAEADLKRIGTAAAAMPTAQVPALDVAPPAPEAEFFAPPAEVSFADILEPTSLSADVSAAEAAAPAAEVLPPHPPEAPPAAAEGPSVVRPSEGIVFSQFVAPEGEVPTQAIETAPFDDTLAWGTGERSSRAISQKDVDAALHEHEAALAAPSTELDTPGAAPHVEAQPLPTEEAWAGPPQDGITLELTPEGRLDVPVTPPPALYFAEPAPPAPAAEPEPARPEAPAAEAEAEPAGRSSLADLPLIMPEDVTPPEEMARPAARHAPVEAPEPAPSAVEAGDPEQPPLLTETMGDLYLRQGFRAEAAEVYRRLLAQRPGDAGLAAKLAALEAPSPAPGESAEGGESARGWLRRVAAARVGGPAPAPEAPPAGPTPLEQAFAQPEPEPDPGEPARQASEAFTLDAIFGATGAAPVAPPPEPEPPPPPTGTSFDDFFGAPPEQGSVRPDASAAPEAHPDDVGSFNTWLRGLKR